MSIARRMTQGLIGSPALPAVATLGGWLRLDRVLEWSWRLARRSHVRMLTPVEIHEAIRVFDNSIPYEEVRVVEHSSLAQRIAALSGKVHLPQGQRLAVTVFHTLHFSTALQPGNADVPWMIHELTHVWQYCQWGPRYMTDALQAQARYGPEAYDISAGVAAGWAWEAFNPEQQAEIARAYYEALQVGTGAEVYEPYVEVLRRGRG
jgi:hypothetical protein